VADRVQLFGIEIDAVTLAEAVDRVSQIAAGPFDRCHYVVTPNVDHTVLLQHHLGLRAAYRDAELVLADGAPVVLAAKLLGRALPQRVAGSDLVPALLAACEERPMSFFLLGAAPGVGEIAAENIGDRWPAARVVGTYSPPLGFEKDAAENERILEIVRDTVPDVLVVGLGAPKQELWVHRHRHRLQAKVALCAGATIDFLAEERVRAPVWMQRTGLEWAHRLASEPRRLFKRYLRDACIFPQLVWREWRGGIFHPAKTIGKSP